VFPGQLRPTFESYDRAKRALMTGLAVLWGVGTILLFRSPFWGVSAGVFVVGLVIIQLVYARRIAVVRRVAATLAQRFPADRFLVGNARLVGADDSDVGSVRFNTVVVQLSERTISLWNPGVGASPFMVIPRAGSVVDVVDSKPPRLRVVSFQANATTYLALFASSGLGYERSEQLAELARDYGTR
jgi:hypothetical protein